MKVIQKFDFQYMQKMKIFLVVFFLSVTVLQGCAPSTGSTAVKPVARQPVVKTGERDAVGTNGVVSSASQIASEIGVEIMQNGGNAIDAAVATGFALGAFVPEMNGLGGGGFMTIKTADGHEVVVDFREVAPAAATGTMFFKNLGIKEGDKNEDTLAALGGGMANKRLMMTFFTGKAVGVPGDVAGLLTALEKYGTMSISQVLEPIIRRMEKGIPVTMSMDKTGARMFRVFSIQKEAGKLYLNEDGFPRKIGDVFHNPDLVNTFKLIIEKGRDGFYKGPLAQKMAGTVKGNGGLLTTEDLANYTVQIRKPIKGTYRGYEILSVSPPSSGGAIVIEILNILENYDMAKLGHNTAESLHVWSEAMYRGFLDRKTHLGDPAYVDVPLQGLISKAYAKKRHATIAMNKITAGLKPGAPKAFETQNTTHYSVMDKAGNIVSCTKSVNTYFGTAIVAKGAGFPMNNHMMDFDMVPGGSNQIEPGKRPLSSMSPTIVLKDGEPFLIIGSPGGPSIISAVSQVISNVVDHGMNIQQAIEASRIYAYPGIAVKVENGISAEAKAGLKARGHKVISTSFIGAVSAIQMLENGLMHGGADPRRQYKAIAY